MTVIPIRSLFIAIPLVLPTMALGASSNDYPITQSQINQPGGVAGLNDKAVMTSPIQTSQLLTMKKVLVDGSATSINLPQDKFISDAASPFTLGSGPIDLIAEI